ncbi:hypothetical protein FRC02_012276 [Tulasnella sp. 418]|nr:hypothetical protein FRC02_012276 [Tulasnella sp. 418]
MLATTPMSPEEVDRMIDGNLSSENSDCTSNIDAGNSNNTFDIENLVQLDSKYLLTLFSGGKSMQSGKDRQAAVTTIGVEAEDKPDDDVWDPDDSCVEIYVPILQLCRSTVVHTMSYP